MAVKKVLETFADRTSMHGVPRVIHARSSTKKIFWSIVCIAAAVMFCMQVSELLKRYFSYPKKVTVELVVSPVPFPAISLCNMRNLDFYVLNTINRKFIDDPHATSYVNDSNPFIRSYMRLLALYDKMWYEYHLDNPEVFEELHSRLMFSSNINESIISEAAIVLDEFVVTCTHGGKSCNTSRDFEKFFDAYYFNCFTYTAPSHHEGHQAYSLSEGIDNGWSSVVFIGGGMLDVNSEARIMPGLHQAKSALAGSEGVRVVIHPPGTQPFPCSEGYDVPPGYSASFGIRPRLNMRIGQPHGNCNKENPFEGATTKYRFVSCQRMCLQKYVIARCKCFDVSLPSLSKMDVPPCRRSDMVPDQCTEHASEECMSILKKLYARIQCVRKVRVFLNKHSTLITDCSCFHPCEEIDYDVSYSLAKWPASGFEGDLAYHEVFYIEQFQFRFSDTSKFSVMSDYISNTSRQTAMKNFARLNVYVAESNVVKTVESPDYLSSQLVSDIGGQLGLWVGISVITLTELLELVGDLFTHLCRRRKSSR